MRTLSLLSLAACVFAPTAWSCDLYPTTRPADVTGYVSNAMSCLDQPPEPVSFDADAEAHFATSINAARHAEGLPALRVRPELRPAARFHSLDQIWNGTFGHEGAAGRSQGDRISALDRKLVRSFSAENVAQASGDFDPAILPGILHNGLMDSPGHRRNILAQDATHMAIGVARLRDSIVVTQLFVREEGELLQPAPTQFANLQGANEVELTDWSAHNVSAGPSNATELPDCTTNCPDTLVSVIEVEGRKPLDTGAGFRIIYLSGPSWDVPNPATDVAATSETLRKRPDWP